MTLRKIAYTVTLLSLTLLLPSLASTGGNPKAAPAPSRPSNSDRQCVPVGGMLMTNFGAFGADLNTTLGTATGDLRGAVSGTLLGVPQPGSGNTVIFRVQHHWVTETGDALFFDPATATTVPIASGLFAILTYPVHLTGGTGKFAGATGDLTSTGEVNLPNFPNVTGGTTVFRYSGQVCSAGQ